MTRCPACGGRIYADEAERLRPFVRGGFQVIGQPLPLERVTVLVWACSACEFIQRRDR
jgi:hypothetical protein